MKNIYKYKYLTAFILILTAFLSYKNLSYKNNGVLAEEDTEKVMYNFMWENTLRWTTFFENLNGFSKTGDVSINGNEILLQTSAAKGSFASISKTPLTQSVLTFNRKSSMRTAFSLNDPDMSEVYITAGNPDDAKQTSYYGFRIKNGFLYGVSFDGKNESMARLEKIKAKKIYNIEARFTPAKNIIYYVNGKNLNSLSANLPRYSLSASQNLMFIKIQSLNNSIKTLRTSFFDYMQYRKSVQ